MPPLYPLVFEPRFKERVWGGRRLEALYGKPLPPDIPIGESWEISDRPGEESVVANGPLAGTTLRQLMEQQGSDILGRASATEEGRFPLLCKILDARQKLSLQVHPPARARHLGDPKTEMWYIADAEPGAELFVGLKHGVSREQFKDAITAGRVVDCFHRIPVTTGDAMFLPSGRVHAIGAGLVIFEIQQNSDTTFRVYDWDRAGFDGKPRALHIQESVASIDFTDVEPSLVYREPCTSDGFTVRPLVRDTLFDVDLVHADDDATAPSVPEQLRVLACVRGDVTVRGGGISQKVGAGQFCLLPAGIPGPSIVARPGATFLIAEPH